MYAPIKRDRDLRRALDRVHNFDLNLHLALALVPSARSQYDVKSVGVVSACQLFAYSRLCGQNCQDHSEGPEGTTTRDSEYRVLVGPS